MPSSAKARGCGRCWPESFREVVQAGCRREERALPAHGWRGGSFVNLPGLRVPSGWRSGQHQRAHDQHLRHSLHLESNALRAALARPYSKWERRISTGRHIGESLLGGRATDDDSVRQRRVLTYRFRTRLSALLRNYGAPTNQATDEREEHRDQSAEQRRKGPGWILALA
jgi:hypothetical protein